mmetsp:Transcript_123013/g.229863  ORF Transcript_123013/g.229863 Transcript_123013/m.229863 type:complete len:207 (-) Transcript_123013:682-1302(-)
MIVGNRNASEVSAWINYDIISLLTEMIVGNRTASDVSAWINYYIIHLLCQLVYVFFLHELLLADHLLFYIIYCITFVLCYLVYVFLLHKILLPDHLLLDIKQIICSDCIFLNCSLLFLWQICILLDVLWIRRSSYLQQWEKRSVTGNDFPCVTSLGDMCKLWLVIKCACPTAFRVKKLIVIPFIERAAHVDGRINSRNDLIMFWLL